MSSQKNLPKHSCTLPHEDDYPVLSKHPNCWEIIRVTTVKFFLASMHNPRCNQVFRSKENVIAERKRHMKRKTYVFNHPYSIFSMYWDLFLTVALVFGLVFVPVEVAFFYHQDMVFSSWRSYLLVFLDFVYLIDVFVRLNTGFLRNKQVVLSCREVYLHYIFGPYFLLDVFSSIPIELLSYQIKSKYAQTIHTISLLKVYKFVPYIRCLVRDGECLQVSTKNFYFCFYYTMLILVFHWCACINYIIPQYMVYFHSENRWDLDSWVIQANLEVLDFSHQYFACFFRAAVHLLCVDRGYYPVKTVEDATVATISFIIGFVAYSFYFVSMMQILAAQRASRLKYQVIINQVHEYMKHKKLPLSIQKRLITYYDYKYKKRYFREAALRAAISERLRKEMVLYSCKRLVDSVSLFQDLPEAIISDIISLLKAEFFLPNDIIVKAGTAGDAIYFLSSGTVTVLTPTGKEICHLMDGAYFGEIGLIMKNQKRVATVVAIEICETYKLDRKNFLQCFSHESETYKKVEAVAKERFIKAAAIEELHKQYLFERTKPESDLMG